MDQFYVVLPALVILAGLAGLVAYAVKDRVEQTVFVQYAAAITLLVVCVFCVARVSCTTNIAMEIGSFLWGPSDEWLRVPPKRAFVLSVSVLQQAVCGIVATVVHLWLSAVDGARLVCESLIAFPANRYLLAVVLRIAAFATSVTHAFCLLASELLAFYGVDKGLHAPVCHRLEPLLEFIATQYSTLLCPCE